jgi:hypothetical protein
VSGLLAWMLLRPLLERPLRLVACFVMGGVLLAVSELLLERYVDPDLPRVAAATLILALGAAGLYLRASWRRARSRRPCGPATPAAPPARSFAFGIAVFRGPDGCFTRAAVVLDRLRPPAGGGPRQPADVADRLGGLAHRAWRRILAWLGRRPGGRQAAAPLVRWPP